MLAFGSFATDLVPTNVRRASNSDRGPLWRCPLFTGGLNRSTQHFILNGKDGVCGDQSKLSSRFQCGRENGVMGSLATGRVAESDWASIWLAIIVIYFQWRRTVGFALRHGVARGWH